jgi:hypothetical protein
MTSLATKQQVLDAAGYAYNIDREVYFNRLAKKVFSVDFLQDHEGAEIEHSIQESTDGKEWRFYFNVLPPKSVKRQVVESLG